MDSVLARVRPEGARDCGELSTADLDADAGAAQIAALENCLTTALEEGTPFVAIVRAAGVDSTMHMAWLSAEDGSVVRLRQDDYCQCGVTHRCGASVQRATCRGLHVDPEAPKIVKCDELSDACNVCNFQDEPINPRCR